MAGTEISQGKTVHFDVCTHDPTTGGRAAATATTFEVYEEGGDTAILTAQALTLRVGQVGNYRGTFAASSGNSFEVGKFYNVVAEATIGGITAQTVALTFYVKAAEVVTGVPVTDATYVAGTTQTANDNSADINLILEDTGTTIPGLLPTALVNGRMDSSIDATGFEQGAIDNVWDELKSAHVVANSFGDFLDIEVSGRSSHAATDIVTSGAITTSGGAVSNVTLCATTTTNTDVTALNNIAAGDIWAVDATTQQNPGTFGQAIGDPAANTETIYDAVVTDATGINVAVDVVALKAETVLIVEDTGTTIPGLLPTALVGGRMDCSIDATGFEQGAIDNIWDELKSAHVVANSFGDFLDIEVSGVDAAVWAEGTRTLTAATNITSDASAINVTAGVVDTVTLVTTTTTNTDVTALQDISTSDVLTQVNAALDTAISELGVAAPSATPSIRDGIMLMYMALRNKLVVQVTTDDLEIYNNAGTKIAAKSLTDDGTTYTEAEMA